MDEALSEAGGRNGRANIATVDGKEDLDSRLEVSFEGQQGEGGVACRLFVYFIYVSWCYIDSVMHAMSQHRDHPKNLPHAWHLSLGSGLHLGSGAAPP